MGKNISKASLLAKSLVGTAAIAFAFANATTEANAQDAMKPVTGFTIGDPKVTGFNAKIFGVFDAGVVVSDNYRATSANGDKTNFTSTRFGNGQTPSRLGLLGGYVATDTSLSFNYRAEMQINATGLNGSTTAGQLFNRGWQVGVTKTELGSIDLGRMYNSAFWTILAADTTGAGTNLVSTSAMGAANNPATLGKYLALPVAGTANVSGTTTINGAGGAVGWGGYFDNSIRYRTPNFSGVTAEVLYSRGQNASGTNPLGNDGQTYSANVMYNDGPLYVGASFVQYQQVNDVSTRFEADKTTLRPGLTPTGATANVAYGCNSVGTCATWKSRNHTSQSVAARYTMFDVTLGLALTNLSVSESGDYSALGYGALLAYKLGDHRIEGTFGMASASGSTGTGAFGKNLGKAGGDPSSMAFGGGYYYSFAPFAKYYLSGLMVSNNDYASAAPNSDTHAGAFGSSPYVATTGIILGF